MTSQQYRCLIRKQWVAATPEEEVRQRLLNTLVNDLQYPAECLGVEQALHLLPHLQVQNSVLPDRRADVICFAKGIHPQHALYPLLLIECKAIPLNDKVLKQVVGYNHYVGAYFVAVANASEVKTGWYDAKEKKYQFVDGLLPFNTLLNSLRTSVTTSN